MDKTDLKEIERLFGKKQEKNTPFTRRNLRDFLYHCIDSLNAEGKKKD